MELQREFRVNKHITLKLENIIPKDTIFGSMITFLSKKFLNTEGQRTMIYIDGEKFEQCKYLLLDVPLTQIKELDNIKSIDEAEQKLDHSQEIFPDSDKISPETEFWAHCSNLQAWVESGYNTNILHKNLAFPLLKRLTEVGDSQAKKVFKEEIISRFLSGHYSVMKYLVNEGYLEYFCDEEFEFLVNKLREQEIPFVLYGKRKIGFIQKSTLNLSHQAIRNISHIKGLRKFQHLKELNLSNNRIREIKGLENFESLEKLDLSFNQIQEIKGLDRLKNLKQLELQGNQIREIKGLGNLKKLNVLSLWLNPLKFSELGKLLLPPKRLVQYCQNKYHK